MGTIEIMLTIVVQVVIMILPVMAIPIDNGVIGTSVQCTSDSIAVNFTTRNPFSGRIFVKGMSDRPDCIRSYADGGPTPSMPFITFTFGACNMFRSRTVLPQAGMMQMIVVVISFHKLFITKVDRAYKVQCFYTEAEKTVTSHLEVSMISTESLRDTQSMPSCVYEVRRGSRTGDVVRFASVGEAVYHEWECKSDEVRMLIKNCFVDDGQGNKQQIVDEKGCAMDSVILNDLTYETSGNARAWVESHVFKYADKPNLFFQCTIQLCAKGDPQCGSISPPNCSPQRPGIITTTISSNTPPKLKFREKSPADLDSGQDRQRMIRSHKISPVVEIANIKSTEIDLLTDSISVLDLEDQASNQANLRGHPKNVLITSPIKKSKQYESSKCQDLNSVCMSTTGFILMMITMIILLISTFISAVFVRVKQRLIDFSRSNKKP